MEDLSGSTLLQTIDKFALNNHNASHQIMSDNVGMYCIYDIIILNYGGMQLLNDVNIPLQCFKLRRYL